MLAGRLAVAASVARISASGRCTRPAGPAISGSSRIRALSWPARCRSWPICRLFSGSLVAKPSTGPSPSTSRACAGVSRSRRNGPCSGGRFAVTGPDSRSRPDPAGLGVRLVMSSTASGVPSGSCSSRWLASAGTALVGRSSVTAMGHGVPSASSARIATAAASAGSR